MIVTWNSSADIARAVASVPQGVPVVVVDNASADGAADLAEEARTEGLDVIRLARNVGFGPACNLGARAGGEHFDAILFLNPDAALERGAEDVSALLTELYRDRAVGAVAPALTGEGQERFQLRLFPTLGSLFREALLLNRLWPENAGFRRERYLDRRRGEPFDVEQPAAAALMVRADVFEEIGGFDAAFQPAWFEDVDLCRRIWGSGRRIRFVPGARATHVGGVSMRSLAYRDFLPLYTRNLFRYLARHESVTVWTAARGIVAAGTLLRMALLPFVHGDHGFREAAAAYGRVLRGLMGLGWVTRLAEVERK